MTKTLKLFSLLFMCVFSAVSADPATDEDNFRSMINEKYQLSVTEVDLVFSDVHLLGSSLDGFELGRWIRNERPEIKVLLASGEVPSPGPDGEVLLAKPYKYPELVRRVRDLLAHDSP